jgi:hypothetical protein
MMRALVSAIACAAGAAGAGASSGSASSSAVAAAEPLGDPLYRSCQWQSPAGLFAISQLSNVNFVSKDARDASKTYYFRLCGAWGRASRGRAPGA